METKNVETKERINEGRYEDGTAKNSNENYDRNDRNNKKICSISETGR